MTDSGQTAEQWVEQLASTDVKERREAFDALVQTGVPAIAAIGGPFTSRRTLNSPAFSGTVEVKNATAAGFDSVALGDISSAGVQDGFGFSLEVDTISGKAAGRFSIALSIAA